MAYAKKKAEHEARPSPTGRYEDDAPKAVIVFTVDLGAALLPNKANCERRGEWPLCN
tara:strand:- start:1320 stop:1490 length:171 start_codon:yes stop_codon:yes gene_type:complete